MLLFFEDTFNPDYKGIGRWVSVSAVFVLVMELDKVYTLQSPSEGIEIVLRNLCQ